MHRDFWYKGGGQLPQRKEEQKGFSFNIDNDAALILALILLLQREKSDPILTVALLYILS